LGLRRIVVALVLFGISFGYVEAAVVVYLRAIYDPLRQRLHPDRPTGELFPLILVEELQAAGPENLRRLATELGREAATMLVLAAAALAVARNPREWLAAFVVVFGVWDIFFYMFLKLLMDWPASLLTWDLLFLIPVPWAAPVLAPVVASITMIAGGVVVLWREHGGRPVAPRGIHWAALVAAGAILVASFTWDYRDLLAGGMPNPFPWWLFASGEAAGVGALVHALRQDRR